MQILHPILVESDIQAVKESSQQPSNCSHYNKDKEMVGIPKCTSILKTQYIYITLSQDLQKHEIYRVKCAEVNKTRRSEPYVTECVSMTDRDEQV